MKRYIAIFILSLFLLQTIEVLANSTNSIHSQSNTQQNSSLNNITITESNVTTRPSNYVRVKGSSNIRKVSYYQVQQNGKWIANANENYGSFMIDFRNISWDKVYDNVKIVAYNNNNQKIAESNSFKITLDGAYKGTVVGDEYVEPDGVNRARKSISVYSKGTYHLESLEKSMRTVREFGVGIDEIIISIGIGNNCETNSPEANLTKKEIIRLCNYAKSVGYKKITLKCHSAGEYDGQGNQSIPQNPALWHSRYKNIVDMISDVAVEQGHKDFIVSNELGNITNLESNKVYWQEIIKLAKSKGLKVGASVNYPEICQNDGYQLFNELDFIGVNTYPSMTKNSKEWAANNIDKLKKAWYVSEDLIETIPMLKQFKETGKEVWVTEAGCIPSTRGLRYPAYWGEGQTPDNEVQEIYYKAMMPVLSSSPYVDVFSIWAGNIDDDFSFMSRPSGNVVKQYWESKNYFSDTKNHWAENQINKFVDLGYVGGYSDGTFKPNNSITRAEFVKILNSTFGITKSSGKLFSDTKNHWAKKDIDIAVTNGVCNGKTATEFKPNDPITREEAAVMIANYKKISDKNYDKISAFYDSKDVSTWAKSGLEGIIEKGYMSGYSDNTFKPKGKITRSEAVSTLSRVK